LEIFEKKFRMSKEDSVETKVLIKKYENRNYDEEIEEEKQELINLQRVSETNTNRCEAIKIKLDTLKEVTRILQEQINSTPSELINITKVRTEHSSKTNTLVSLAQTIDKQIELIHSKEEQALKLLELSEAVNLQELRLQKDSAASLSDKVLSLASELQDIENKQKLLEGIPCGKSYPACKFIKDAHVAAATKDIVVNEREKTDTELLSINVLEIDKQLSEYNNMINDISNLEKEISDLKLKCERNKTAKSQTEFSLKDLETKLKEYNDNKEAIENLEKLIYEKNKHEAAAKTIKKQIETCEQKTLDIVKHVGSREQKLLTLEEQKQEYVNLQNSYAAYDLFMVCMHPNGIAYDVIKKKIPVINQEIAKVLANIVDFEIFFESSGNKFDIFIKHPQYDERPIEMASGAEKTMAAMAIRLSLLSVSSLPKSDLFILDEPGTALDEENMEGFIRILELIKVYFKNVLLISHLDSLKDCVDMQIVIEKKHGYARVNQ